MVGPPVGTGSSRGRLDGAAPRDESPASEGRDASTARRLDAPSESACLPSFLCFSFFNFLLFWPADPSAGAPAGRAAVSTVGTAAGSALAPPPAVSRDASVLMGSVISGEVMSGSRPRTQHSRSALRAVPRSGAARTGLPSSQSGGRGNWSMIDSGSEPGGSGGSAPESRRDSATMVGGPQEMAPPGALAELGLQATTAV